VAVEPSVVLGASLLLSALPAAPTSPCPVTDREPCTLVLAGAGAPSASASCTSEPWSKLLHFTLPGRFLDSDKDGSFETVVEIALDPTKNCGCARWKVFFGSEVSNWLVHVGNSPTNNGHGGDEGTTADTAEVQVAERQLTVFTAARSVRRQVEKLLDATLPPLAGRVIEIEVCDQSLGIQLLPRGREPAWPAWRLETLHSNLLFSLGPGNGGTADETGGSIYGGFNRVIHRITGPPSHDRTGAGVRRVEISLTP
jgi:hypothetical protein